LAVGESERLFYQILFINHEHGFTAAFAVRAAAILMRLSARSMLSRDWRLTKEHQRRRLTASIFLYH
jgi:hypothetical protein